MIHLLCLLITASPVDVSASKPGPYGVGVATWTLTDSTRAGRKLTTEVWYPTEKSAGLEPVREASCVDQPFPLIVFSHGSQASRVQSSYLTTHLASHGYIVAAPDHTGNTVLDFNKKDQFQSALDRPVDVSFIIDEVLRRSDDAANDFSKRVCKDRIAVMGHSFGGYTALVVGGAEVNGRAVADRFGRSVDANTYRRPDSRVTAVVAYAPVGPPILSPEGLRKVTKPLLVFGGTNDQILPFEQHQAPIFEYAGGPCYLAGLQGGSHFAFNNAGLTTIVSFVKPKRKVEELVDRKLADELVKGVTLAFLERHLLGGSRWKTELTEHPPAMSFRSKNIPVDSSAR